MAKRRIESIFKGRSDHVAGTVNPDIYDLPGSKEEKKEMNSKRGIVTQAYLLKNPSRRFRDLLATYLEEFQNRDLQCTLNLWQEAILRANLELSKLVRAELDEIRESFSDLSYEAVFYSFVNESRNELDIPIIWPVIYLEADTQVKNLPDELYNNRIADIKERVEKIPRKTI